ncbi:MAG TPA: ATP-binding protein [Burkholderiales bacterium]|nr:ATP-binding protein [Burkholderiales bacterium]
MRLGIRLKLFLFSLALIAISVFAAEAYLSIALEAQLIDRIRSELQVRARLVAQSVVKSDVRLDDDQAADALVDDMARAAGGRITLIRRDGAVAGDSEVDAARLSIVENHSSRPEIVAALAEGFGASVRVSETIGRRMMYAAVPVQAPGGIVGTARVALPLTEVDDTIARMHRSLGIGALIAILVAIVASLSAAQITSRRLRELTTVARDMAAGNLSTRIRASGLDEVAALGKALDQLADNLSRSLDELRGERDLLTGILSSMNEGVLVIGRDGRIVLTNPALRAMLLIAPDAAGKSVLQVVRSADLNQLLESAARGADAEVELELAGLMPRRALVRAVTLKDAPGGVLAVFVDVTELRRLEAVRRDFVANASHELRSPLTTVRAAAETLRTVENDAKASARFVELIQRNSERLANLIDDLLELSRIESRELKLVLEPLDLSAVVDRTLSQHAHRAQLRHIALAHDVSGAQSVSADRRALEHVFGNLIDNALKYCAEGAAVRISAESDDGIVRVAVADTGPGIPMEHLPRVFERFYRVDAGRSRELGGTGLGLSIVKHLVEAMGGTVSVDSRVGSGSTFSFTLHRA